MAGAPLSGFEIFLHALSLFPAIDRHYIEVCRGLSDKYYKIYTEKIFYNTNYTKSIFPFIIFIIKYNDIRILIMKNVNCGVVCVRKYLDDRNILDKIILNKNIVIFVIF